MSGLSLHKTETRGGTRIPCKISAALASLDPQQPFSDPCHIVLVNQRGCAARFGRPVQMGTPVRLDGLPSGINVTGRIVTCISFGEHEKIWLLGLALDEPGNVWNIKTPPSDWEL